LARRWARHELAECHKVGEAGFRDPAAALDELRTEIPDMGNRAAERCAAEAEKDQKDIPR
jgi:hypothetical protein